ncbi:MAG: hypothetical protein A3I00_03130 [Betaproteobacteria bacterium RIFCSPLOWO2_02_FULL_64_12]|nr:MAG: hypothetical protein A3I00_03130 [Betaproteobacteria bacterium RIFCSPLOWO2_02_FULL_64_12]
MWGVNGFGGGGMGIGMLLFWGLIIAAIVMLVRGFGTGSTGRTANVSDRTPLDILRERYAKGEIEKSDFEQRKRELGG